MDRRQARKGRAGLLLDPHWPVESDRLNGPPFRIYGIAESFVTISINKQGSASRQGQRLTFRNTRNRSRSKGAIVALPIFLRTVRRFPCGCEPGVNSCQRTIVPPSRIPFTTIQSPLAPPLIAFASPTATTARPILLAASPSRPVCYSKKSTRTKRKHGGHPQP